MIPWEGYNILSSQQLSLFRNNTNLLETLSITGKFNEKLIRWQLSLLFPLVVFFIVLPIPIDNFQRT